jgi:hypothetical protein
MCYRVSRTWLAAIVSLVLPAVASAQQAYRITLRQPEKGDKALCRKMTRFRQETAAFDRKTGDKSSRIEETAQDLVFGEEVLQKPAAPSQGIKLRRDYRRAEQTIEGRRLPLPYTSMAVLIEQQGERYRFHTTGGTELKGDQARGLEEEFSKQVPQLPHPAAPWLLPKAAVRVGEPWTIDAARFVRHLGALDRAILEPGRATAKGKLLRAYRKDGRQHGVLELRLEVPIPSFRTASGELLKFKDSKLTVRMIVDACIDGNSFAYRLKGMMEYDIEDVVPFSGTTLDFRARFQGDFFESRQEAGKE